MKDLIEKILKYLPQYLVDFGSVFSGPKRFMTQKHSNGGEVFEKALLFLGISVALVVIMNAPMLPPGKDIWIFLGSLAVTVLLAMSLLAVALYTAWHLVGGKATVRQFFVIHAYFYGVLIAVMTVFSLLGEGVFKIFEPALYAMVIDARLNHQPIPDLSRSSIPVISGLIRIVGFFFCFGWGLIAWGAYRELNGLNKGRSFIAAVIFLVLGPLLVAPTVFFFASAMM